MWELVYSLFALQRMSNFTFIYFHESFERRVLITVGHVSGFPTIQLPVHLHLFSSSTRGAKLF
jgi:hypothetical protein